MVKVTLVNELNKVEDMAGRRDMCFPSICLSFVSQDILGSQF